MKKHQAFVASVMAGLGILLGTASARASVTYSYAFDQASYEVAPGQSINVPVYLQESVDGTDVPKLTTQNGLATASVLLQKTSANQAVTITNITANPGFNMFVITTPDLTPFTSDTASFFGQVLDPLTDPSATHGILPTETPSGSGVWRVLLGEFQLTATGNPGDSDTFQATIINSGMSDISTFDAYAALTNETLSNTDGSIYAPSVSFTITAVPEPSTIALLALGVSALTIRRRHP